jgi:hypothetical protein
MSKKLLVPLIVLFSSILVFFISKPVYEEYYRTYCPSVVRKSELTLPEYKNATPIVTKSEEKKGGYYMKTFEFTTPDSPEAVMAFYTEALQNAGWRVVSQTNNILSLDEKRGLPIYGVTMYLSSIENSTKVDVKFSYAPCLYY